MEFFNPTNEMSTLDRIEKSLESYSSIPIIEYWASSFIIDISELKKLSKDIHNRIVISIINELQIILDCNNIQIVENNIIVTKKVYSSHELSLFFENISFSMHFFYMLRYKIFQKYGDNYNLGFATTLSLGNELTINNQNYFLTIRENKKEESSLATLSLKSNINISSNLFKIFISDDFYINLKSHIEDKNPIMYSFEYHIENGMKFIITTIGI